MDIADLLDASEVAELLGIQRRSVYHMTKHLHGFPQPTLVKTGKPFWDRREVKAWRESHPARHQRKR
ncbi:MAG: hypothetical protein ABW022_14775 [Actinoplanes sp.]